MDRKDRTACAEPEGPEGTEETDNPEGPDRYADTERCAGTEDPEETE